ncbi:DnaJ domain containing protein [Plasmodium malariae]|uniref:DnaJ domain containing protein n=1 Tax=Plasmodium malariae TaxID=5858 RepID=A0A1A8WV34_PLAMA|nr:DnaJ domain containing protein [Plasmodium malariae]
MEEIIVHMIIIAPLTKWLISPNRSWNKGKREYGVYIALLILFCVGLYELRKPNQNLYEILTLNANASRTDIQQSFRKLSRIYHPDKNKSQDAFERFNKIREAYEILSNEKKKYLYDRFGDFGVMNAILLIDVYFIDEDTELYVSTFCEYVFENNIKCIKNFDDAVLFCARLVDGKVKIANNYSWREEDAYSHITNIHELDDEQMYDKNCDKNDLFYKLLYNVVETSTEDVELKVPKKELCRRFDWSRWYTTTVLEKNTADKDFEEGNATKGIIFSSLLYFIGLVSHLLSK